MAEQDWLSILRALDEPLPHREPYPSIYSFMRPVEGSPGTVRADEAAILSMLRARHGDHVGWEIPRDFDRAATQARFNLLAERLSAAYGVPLAAGTGPQQDAACFGDIAIPPAATKLRVKRSRFQYPLTVVVSNFGNLATYHHVPVRWGPLGDLDSRPEPEWPPVHPDDQRQVDEALTTLGYLVVPRDVLDARYDGPNAGPTSDMTWYTRFFSYL